MFRKVEIPQEIYMFNASHNIATTDYWEDGCLEVVIIIIAIFQSNFSTLNLGRVQKNIFMENSILEGGVSEGHFPYPIIFIFFASNGLKIIFKH